MDKNKTYNEHFAIVWRGEIMREDKKKIIIIGAGPAGLTAAFELLQKHQKRYNVEIFEASDSIGGISRTVRYSGNRMDIGGHRFFSKDDRVMQWWSERMPMQGMPAKDDLITGAEKPLSKNGVDPEKTDLVMLYRNRVSRIYYLRKFFDYPISLKPQLFINMGLSNTIQAGFSYLVSMFHKLPETSLENFYINRFGRKLYSMFFENYTEKVWGRKPARLSADWGSQRVKGLSVIRIFQDMFRKALPKSLKEKQVVETSLIEQFWYPKYGPGQLWEKTALDIQEMDGIIHMNSEVCRFNFENGRMKSIIYVQDGVEHEAKGDIFISSMPLKDLVAGMGDSVPSHIRAIAAGLPYRDFITVGLLLKNLKLKNETRIVTPYNRIPDCWIYIQEPAVKMGRLQVFNNWSPYLTKDFEHSVNIGLEYFCNEGDELWSMTNEDLVQFATAELIAMDIIDENAVLDSHVERVKKAYPSYFDTYSDIGKLIEWLDQTENLFCVGRNGQHRYNNMDHSMATSFEAVEAIVNESADHSPVWNVNTEKSYHEGKQKTQSVEDNASGNLKN